MTKLRRERAVRWAHVWKAGWPAWYVCYPFPGGLKCGKCMRGRVEPKEGYRCRVCKATVINIQYEPEPCAALTRKRK